MDLMKASISHQVRPSVLILGKDSGKRWGKWDFLLAKAYQRFLNELCQQCGLPKYICHTDDNRVQFKTVRDECASTAAAERAQEQMVQASSKSYGIKVSAEPYLTLNDEDGDIELSDLRRSYLIDRAKRAGLVPEDYEEL